MEGQKLLQQGPSFLAADPVRVGKLKLAFTERLDRALKLKAEADREIFTCQRLLTDLYNHPDEYFHFQDYWRSKYPNFIGNEDADI